MKQIKFRCFGLDMLLLYEWHCTKRGQYANFQSLEFKWDENLKGYMAEMRLNGEYLIKVMPFGINNYHMEIYASGGLREIIAYCTDADVTTMMRIIQDGEYLIP